MKILRLSIITLGCILFSQVAIAQLIANPTSLDFSFQKLSFVPISNHQQLKVGQLFGRVEECEDPLVAFQA